MAQAKRKTRTQKNNWLGWLFFTIIFGLLIGGVFLIRNFDTSTSNEPNFTEQMKSFFKPDGSVATFNLAGNTLVESTTWLNEQFVQLIIVNNGGTKQEIYRIGEQTIDLVFYAPRIEHAQTFTAAELQNLQAIDTILHWPLTSKSFGSKTMTYPVPFETSYLIFANAVSVERSDESGKTINYYAEGYGFIGREYFINGTLFHSIQLNILTE